jgi:hypothetical protein
LEPGPYELVARWTGRAPGYADRLKELRVFDGLTAADALKAADQIADLVHKFLWFPESRGLADERLIEQLTNKAMNIPAGADDSSWEDPQRAALAFAMAKSALTPKPPQRFPWWNTESEPEADPTC